MVGHSIPVAAVVGDIAGVVGGELSGYVVKKMRLGPTAERLAVKIGHSTCSTLVGWWVNVKFGDVLGFCAQPFLASAKANMYANQYNPHPDPSRDLQRAVRFT